MKQGLVTGGLALAAALLAGGATLFVTSGTTDAAAPPSTFGPSSAPARTTVIPPEPAEVPRASLEVHTPTRASPERAALMDALRVVVEPKLGSDVVFVVTDLKVKGDWAFGVLEPTHRDGSAIALEATPMVRNDGGNEDMFDGLRTEAIWRLADGHWRVDPFGLHQRIRNARRQQ